jgi:hypothetical protein
VFGGFELLENGESGIKVRSDLQMRFEGVRGGLRGFEEVRGGFDAVRGGSIGFEG